MSLTLSIFGESAGMGEAALASLIFGVIGIVLLLIGYFVFDLLVRRIDVQEQLQKGNMAVAIVMAALLLAIAYIAAHAVS
jgi:putative membrane protein